MSITDTELAQLRADAEAEMPDTCAFTRAATDTPTLNTGTGALTIPDPTVVYTGACRIRALGPGSVADHGDGLVTVSRYAVTVPYDAGPLAVGDVAVFAATTDPQIGTRAFRIVDRAAGSNQIDQRVTVEEVVDRV